jgi:peptidoglycan/LPS O-acetylase OafA/YrhL
MEKRANNFDLLRFALATLVIYSHSYALALGVGPRFAAEPFRRLSRGQITGGEIAVNGFFAISGFLILRSFQSCRNTWVYLQRRVARIYPGYLVCAAVCLVVFGPVAVSPAGRLMEPEFLARYAQGALSLQIIDSPFAFHDNPFPDTLNGSSWTILYEFWCYLFIAVAARLFLPRFRIAFPALLVMFIVVPSLQPRLGLPQWGDFVCQVPVVWDGPWPGFIAYFLSGCCCSLYDLQRLGRRSLDLAALLLIVLACAAGYGLNFVGPVAGSYLLIRLSSSRPIGQSFTRKGDYSYGLYLYAFPIQQTLVAAFHLSPLPLFFLAFPLSLGCAASSWRLIERPMLARKPN